MKSSDLRTIPMFGHHPSVDDVLFLRIIYLHICIEYSRVLRVVRDVHDDTHRLLSCLALNMAHITTPSQLCAIYISSCREKTACCHDVIIVIRNEKRYMIHIRSCGPFLTLFASVSTECIYLLSIIYPGDNNRQHHLKVL